MEIPDNIKIFNQTIDIIYDNDYCNAKDILGEADINHNQIRLCNHFGDMAIPIDRQLHTLFHELTHCMLFMIGQTSVYKDEVLTDNFATVLEDLILNNFMNDINYHPLPQQT